MYELLIEGMNDTGLYGIYFTFILSYTVFHVVGPMIEHRPLQMSKGVPNHSDTQRTLYYKSRMCKPETMLVMRLIKMIKRKDGNADPDCQPLLFT
ncbi:hypothetical protein N781_06330 [Pontibacillus halophilus JSM 076056 = DSM 19796]|uniref:Uncharacterized protein n=1 Tax=Pontibacillus halophilus JSM 076056 = DSM 19796 TaxID=1385510 RepID=A0A0A5GC37_9BACI|nr:hypothetical protein [Pontibacillus halophilus]KGX90751.1 hypothetical protein N781_06330 [Pontibacillus halophilus JSM 076056 = DSM 19796]